MKSAFATSLIAAVCSAAMPPYEPHITYIEPQYEITDPVIYDPAIYEHEEPRVSMDDVFEMNDDGSWQFKAPDVPKVTFNDIDQKAIDNWATEKEAVYRDMDSRWAEAWKSYQAAIAKPWDDFLTSVEGLIQEGHDQDWKTNEEVFTFICNNTYIDGKSIAEKFPESVEWFKEVKAEADARAEEFSLSQLRAPVKVHQEYSEDGELMFKAPRILQYQFHDGGHSDYEVVYVYGNGHGHGHHHYDAEMTSFAEQIGAAAISYGYNQAEVDAFFAKAGADWKALNDYQGIARANLAQAQIEEASLYIKMILDAALNDLRAHMDARNHHIHEDLNVHVDEYYRNVENQSRLNFDALSAWMESMYSSVNSLDVTTGRTIEDHEADWGTRVTSGHITDHYNRFGEGSASGTITTGGGGSGRTVTTVTTETRTIEQPSSRSATFTITPGSSSSRNISGNASRTTTTSRSGSIGGVSGGMTSSTTRTVSGNASGAAAGRRAGSWTITQGGAAPSGRVETVTTTTETRTSNAPTTSLFREASRSSSSSGSASVSASTLKMKAESKTKNFAYGFGIAALAAAIVGGGLLYQQKKQKDAEKKPKDNLLTQDTEFALV